MYDNSILELAFVPFNALFLYVKYSECGMCNIRFPNI